MKVNIELDLSKPLNDEEKRVLHAIAGDDYMPVKVEGLGNVGHGITFPAETAEVKEVVNEINEEVVNDAEDSKPEIVTTTLQDTNQPVETDANGLPWDHRIHAGTQTKTKDLVWKRRKGVSDEEFESVIVELKQTMSAGKPSEATEVRQAFEIPAPPAADVPPPPQAEEPEVSVTFPELLKIAFTMKSNGLINDEQREQIASDLELPNFMSLNSRPDLIPQALKKLKTYESANS